MSDWASRGNPKQAANISFGDINSHTFRRRSVANTERMKYRGAVHRMNDMVVVSMKKSIHANATPLASLTMIAAVTMTRYAEEKELFKAVSGG